MKLYIQTIHPKAKEFYLKHGHFHKGDAGLDLYILEDILFLPKETKKINLGIKWEPEDGKSYYLFPRSSTN